MFRNYNGKLVKVNKFNFKSEKDYYVYLLKKKYNVVLKNNESVVDNIIFKIKTKYTSL